VEVLTGEKNGFTGKNISVMSKRKHEGGEEKVSSKRHKRSESHSSKVEKKISSRDYYKKTVQFQYWLTEVKKKRFNDLEGEQQKKYFKKFVKEWNKGNLDKRYYKKGGISVKDIPMQRTSYNWNMTQEAPGVFGPPLPEPYVHESKDGDGDIKGQRRAMRKQVQLVQEELVPKPSTPHEAKRERNRSQQQARKEAENDDGGEVNEYDDGGDSFQSRLNRANSWQERKAKEQMARAQAKFQAYKDREDKALAKYREMARQAGYDV